MIRKVFLVLACALIVGCTDGQVAESGSAALPNSAQDLHQLVFFLDPSGGPCIMQAQILAGMEGEFRDRVVVRFVQTTVPEDRGLFARYGIRGLPALLLADASGQEVRRLSPGVKSAGEVRSLIELVN
ncbi:thioredoxin family protein [Geoalkalibacter halelectricus]|uniref:thioredoxin family protein n=1 Tax=Geoalkalibacter halelectricus TaxID=2847045 RepID=UPI003D2441A6